MVPVMARMDRRQVVRCGVAVAGLSAVSAAVGGRRFLELAVSRAADAAGPPDRVQAARARLGNRLQQATVEAGVAWPPKEVFVRAFKAGGDGRTGGTVEVWAGDGTGPLARVLSHPVCRLSGVPGPKRREGDLQVPEGYYTISALNPKSSYHLSLRVDYPNASDRVRGRRLDAAAPLGGDIMVHGNCVTIGCIPIEDEPIEEVYLMAAEVFGKRPVPIHIFPRPLDDAGLQALLADAPSEEHRALWEELAVGYRAFEKTRRVPAIRVAADGRYLVTPR
jgi:murein L,D-transpeptidase YafK